MKSNRRYFLKSALAITAAPIICGAENKLDAQLAEQTVITDEQIKKLQARTDSIRLVQQANELDQDLQDFMYKILSEIQSR